MSEQYLVDQKGFFGVAEFHRVVDKQLWDHFVEVAQATLEGTAAKPWTRKPGNVLPTLTSEEANMVVNAHALVSTLPVSASVPEANDYKALLLDDTWGIERRRSWYGAYIPVGFTSTLSLQARNKDINVTYPQWKANTVDDIFSQFPTLLALIKHWSVPHDPSMVKKIRTAALKIEQGDWEVHTYNPAGELAAGEGYALFLTHQNLYYTGRNKNSPSLCGALMYPSVAAAERAMKSSNTNNYIVVKAQLEAVQIVGRGVNALDNSVLQSAMDVQQAKRLQKIADEELFDSSKIKRKL